MNQTKFFCSFLIGMMLITCLTIPSFSESSIEIFTLNSEIHPTDDIFVSGFISAKSSYKPVILEVYDPNGKLLYNPHVYFNDQGQFSWLIHPPLGKFELDGNYTVIASQEDVKEPAEIHFVILKNNTYSNLVANSNIDNSVTPSKIILNSYEFGETKPKIQEEKISVKTTNLQVNQKNEIGEFISSNELKFVLPISIAIVALMWVIWNRTAFNKHETKKNSS